MKKKIIIGVPFLKYPPNSSTFNKKANKKIIIVHKTFK